MQALTFLPRLVVGVLLVALSPLIVVTASVVRAVTR